MKATKNIVTKFGTYVVPIKEVSVEKNYPLDSELTKEEVDAVKRSLDLYPSGGLGECLIKADNKRGYKRHPEYSKFTTKKAPMDSIRCPVLVLKEDFSPAINFAEHLRQYRRIRNHVAKIFEIDLIDARFLYNHLLRTDPTELSKYL